MNIDFSRIPKYRGFGFKNKLFRLAWTIVYIVFFRTAIYPYGRYVRVLLLRCFGAKIDWSSIIYPSARIWLPSKLTIGARSVLGPDVYCYNPGGIRIGRKVTISQGTYLCGGGHTISELTLPFECAPIVVNDCAWICANCFIKYGVVVGEGAVVGATSSVYHTVPDWTVVGGNPAKEVKKRVLSSNTP